MITSSLAPTPNWTVPARFQFTTLLASGRVWLLLAVCLAPLLYLEAARFRDAAASASAPDAGVWPAFLDPGFTGWIFLLIPAAWALLVWRGEPWGEREHAWSLPVDRTAQALWRVAAGAAWLVAGVALYMGVGFLLALNARELRVLQIGPPLWVNSFTSSLIVYGTFSIAAVAARRPLEWIIYAGVGLTVHSLIAQGFRVTPLLDLERALSTGRFGMKIALNAGHTMEWLVWLRTQPVTFGGFDDYTVMNWLTAAGLWLAAAAAGLVLAARRRR